jgi:hypothetical protein
VRIGVLLSLLRTPDTHNLFHSFLGQDTSLVQPDREAGPEIRGVGLALEQAAVDARVDAAAQEAVLPVDLGALRGRAARVGDGGAAIDPSET